MHPQKDAGRVQFITISTFLLWDCFLVNVRPMRAALRSSINGSTARGGSDLGGVGPTGLKWVIQYTPSVIYIYI